MARTTWRIEYASIDHYNLTRDGRPVADDITMPLIEQTILKQFTPNDRVVDVAEDGYFTDVTRDYKRQMKKVPTRGNNPEKPSAAPVMTMTAYTYLTGKHSRFAVDGAWNQSIRPSEATQVSGG